MLLFGDVNHLTQDVAFDYMSEQDKPIPAAVDMLFAGFPCKDFSSLNCQKKDRRSCLLTGEFSSGGGFRGLMEYMEKHRPRIVILENVASTDHTLDEAWQDASADVGMNDGERDDGDTLPASQAEGVGDRETTCHIGARLSLAPPPLECR